MLGSVVRALPALLLAVVSLGILASPAGAQSGGEGGVIIAKGPAAVDRPVTGDVVVLSGPVRISAPVNGNVVVFSGQTMLERGARVTGDVTWAETQPRVGSGAEVLGQVQRFGGGGLSGGPGAGLLGGLAFWLAVSVSTLVLGLVLLWLGPRAADAAVATARGSLGSSLGWGIFAVIGLPLIALLLVVTLLAIPLSVGLFLALLPLYSVGYVTTCWLLGRRVISEAGRPVTFLAGWGILRLVALVPILGGLTALLAAVLGLGVLFVAAWRARTGGREGTVEPAVT